MRRFIFLLLLRSVFIFVFFTWFTRNSLGESLFFFCKASFYLSKATWDVKVVVFQLHLIDTLEAEAAWSSSYLRVFVFFQHIKSSQALQSRAARFLKMLSSIKAKLISFLLLFYLWMAQEDEMINAFVMSKVNRFCMIFKWRLALFSPLMSRALESTFKAKHALEPFRIAFKSRREFNRF